MSVYVEEASAIKIWRNNHNYTLRARLTADTQIELETFVNMLRTGEIKSKRGAVYFTLLRRNYKHAIKLGAILLSKQDFNMKLKELYRKEK